MITFCNFANELKYSFSGRMNATDFVNLLLCPQLEGLNLRKIPQRKAYYLLNGRQDIPNYISTPLHDYDPVLLEKYISSKIVILIKKEKTPQLLSNLAGLIEADLTLDPETREKLREKEENENLSGMLTDLLRITLEKSNRPDGDFIHRAPKLAPWPEMPDFSGYISRIIDFYVNIRTLLYNEKPKPFYDFYVCNNLELRPYFLFSIRNGMNVHDLFEYILDVSIKKLCDFSNYNIITGTGGLGKSMMMRNLLLKSAYSFNNEGMIPVFVPLKDFTSEETDLFEYIYDKFTDGGIYTDISKDSFIETLKHNRFQFLLDGYDEIKSNCINYFDQSLDRFIRKYPDNVYVLSSRPFELHGVLSHFISYDLVPFTKKQSLELIRKLEFRPDEPSIKEKFAKQLDDTLYDTHREFASNPLLLTIMLMTFEQYAEVPSKMHVFYREAYATLAQKHDASKGAYKRALKTGMSADKFSDYFAEFCARTYKDEKYEMTHEEIVDYFNKLTIHKKTDTADFTADDFIYDLQHNLCLLYQESGKYHFTHRSFQEYFCALYFSLQKDKDLARIGNSFETRRGFSSSDKTFSMLYDMIPEKVEEYIFLPYLKKLFDECVGNDEYWTYLTKFIKNITINPDFMSRPFLRKYYDLYRVPFIKNFILNSVIKRKCVTSTVTYPVYKEFVEDEFDVMELPDGNVHIMPPSYNSKSSFPFLIETEDGLTKECGPEDIRFSKSYSYKFDFTIIFENKEKYTDLVNIFESDNFQPYIDFYALKEYYNNLKRSVRESEDESLDFL